MKYLYITLGLLFFTLGAIGVFLPVLPTTPFLLLASACFSKGSVRFNNWFKSTKLYKEYFEGFIANKSMTLKTKLFIVLPVSAVLLLAFYFLNNISIRILLVVVLIIKYYYFIFEIRTIPSKPSKQTESMHIK